MRMIEGWTQLEEGGAIVGRMMAPWIASCGLGRARTTGPRGLAGIT